jgi:hypothetical protein
MTLKKFSSSDAETIENIPEELKSKEAIKILINDEKLKTLGMQWSVTTDTFQFTLKKETANINTRRIALSDLASTFDPLGLLALWFATQKDVLWHIARYT